MNYTNKIKKPQNLIIEGLHLLGFNGIRDLADVSIFINSSSETRLQRVVKRDTLESGECQSTCPI